MPKAYEVITDRTINDEFFVTGKHPIDESQGYKLIQKDKIIKAHTPDGMQPFRIMDVNKRLGYIEFEAWPLLYADLRKKLIKPFTLRVATGQSVLNTFVGNLLLDTPFTFNSNIIDTHDFKVQDETEAEQDPNQLYDALDILKRIVNRWGGELVIDGYDIRMVDRIGKDTDALLYEKKNITDFVDKESIQEIVTRLHGKAEWTEDNPNGGDQITKRIQTTVNSPLINAYSGIVFEQQFTNNDIHTEQELKDWLNLKFNTENIDKPSRSIELDTNIIDATEIALGDTLNLKYLKHDVDMQIRVMRYQYDGFYKRYIKIYVGDFEEHFTGSVQNSITTVETNVKNSVDKTIAHVIVNQLGLKIVYSEYEPEGDYSEGDIWFDNKGGMFFWNEESANWIPHPFNNRVDAIGQEVENVIKQADADRETAEQNFELAVVDAATYTNTKAQEFDNKLVAVNQEVANVTQAANTAVLQANKAVEDAGFAKVDAASAKQTASAASGSALEALGLAQQVNTNVNTLTMNYDVLTQTVSAKAEKATVEAVSGIVNRHTNEIAANAEAVKLRLTSAQVDNLVSQKGYATTNQLTATSGTLTSLITGVQTNLDNLEIGGRNLLRGSEVVGVLSNNGSLYPVTQETLTEGGIQFRRIMPHPTLGNGIISLYENIRASDISNRNWKGKNITFSIRFRSGRKDFNFTIGPWVVTNGQNIRPTNVYIYPIGTWQMVSYTFVDFPYDLSETDIVRFMPAMNVNMRGYYLDLRGYQIEFGNKATDWTPAPEDQATKTEFTELNQTVNSLSGRVGNSEGQLSALELRVSGIQTTVADKADKTQVNQLSNQWTQTTNLVNGHTSQISSLGAQINLRVTAGQVTEAILADKTILDTRNTNQSPAWYNSNYPRRSIVEFKDRAIMEVQGSSRFVQVTTESPWIGSSGGEIVQTAKSSDGTFQRSSIGGLTSWGPWEKIIEAGELISQINIQSGNILIQTGKLYLDTTSTHMTTAYVNDLKAKSLEAVYADIATLKAKVLTADVITSTMLKSDTALIDKIFATDANVNRLTAKTAFINSVKAIDIAADRITTGTLNAANVAIINLNANRIVTGTVSGANSAWNLNTGIQTFTNPTSGDVLQLSQGQIQFQNGAQTRLLQYNAEGLILVAGAGNTGTSLNTSIHLNGGVDYIQFNNRTGTTKYGRIEMSSDYAKIQIPSAELRIVDNNDIQASITANYFKTVHNTGNFITMQQDRIYTPSDSRARNIYLEPNGTGSVVAGTASGTRWNVVASDFVKQSSRTTKTNIIPLQGGLDVINALQPVSYNKLDKLNQGIYEIEKGFISEDSPMVATKDGLGIYDSHITAHLVKAVQELDLRSVTENSKLKARIKELENKVKQLEEAA